MIYLTQHLFHHSRVVGIQRGVLSHQTHFDHLLCSHYR